MVKNKFQYVKDLNLVFYDLDNYQVIIIYVDHYVFEQLDIQILEATLKIKL